jgi:hypothetical protein
MKPILKQLVNKIDGDLEHLYNSIHPVEFELREKIWKAWNEIMDAQAIMEDISDDEI